MPLSAPGLAYPDAVDLQAYLDHVGADADRVADLAPANLTRPVPACPGWNVREVVSHLAEVYEHKIACTERGRQPDPWPPAWPADRDPVEWMADARGRLLELLRARGPEAASYTWFPADQSVGFWGRRMAHETVVHRVDVEQAVAQPSRVDPSLAVDGIDEVLQVCLAGDWSDEPFERPLDEAVGVRAASGWWRVDQHQQRVEVSSRPGAVEGQVSGDPAEVMLWLWGRAPDTAVEMTGDRAVIQRLRDRLKLATQ